MYNDKKQISGGRRAIDEKTYLAELNRLLGFMSAWDRQAAVRRYTWRLQRSSDPAALMRHFGTPTRVAVELAKDYVPSPPPADFKEGLEAEDFEEPDVWPYDEPAPDRSADEKEFPQASPGHAGSSGPGGGMRFLFLLFCVVVAAPVALVLLCVGLPFVGAGVGLVMAAAAAVGAQIGALSLLSDILLLSGAGLMILALGVLLVWFGIWLGFSLAGLWLSKVVGSLGRRIYGEV